jgi:hypothetical protein
LQKQEFQRALDKEMKEKYDDYDSLVRQQREQDQKMADDQNNIR